MGNKKSKNFLVEPDESRLEAISKKTGLTKGQLFSMHQEFLKDCPSGRLSEKAFTKLYDQFYTNGNAKKFCKICFMAYDKDKNGYIDFYEYANVMGILMNGDVGDKLKLAFDIYDYNNDGYIEKKEAQKIVQSIFEMYGESLPEKSINLDVERLMKKFDSDNNGLITENEFITGCLRDDELRRMFVPLFKS